MPPLFLPPETARNGRDQIVTSDTTASTKNDADVAQTNRCVRTICIHIRLKKANRDTHPKTREDARGARGPICYLAFQRVDVFWRTYRPRHFAVEGPGGWVGGDFAHSGLYTQEKGASISAHFRGPMRFRICLLETIWGPRQPRQTGWAEST